MSYTPYEDGEFPQLDDMYTENGERVLIDHDLDAPHQDEYYPGYTDEWWDDAFYTELTYADEIPMDYDF